ncbi:hypothetical protein DV515_00013623 [Chloebia gouldiae]|uniref:Uncharacterized protein n=1 Tax=Chloebia gouldiae TaxID=44316 RepID=A0A3L8S0C6_CHLGU|nr:hypothetical protein DV515_00013623 [Chloebia gouldiae]
MPGHRRPGCLGINLSLQAFYRLGAGVGDPESLQEVEEILGAIQDTHRNDAMLRSPLCFCIL